MIYLYARLLSGRCACEVPAAQCARVAAWRLTGYTLAQEYLDTLEEGMKRMAAVVKAVRAEGQAAL